MTLSSFIRGAGSRLLPCLVLLFCIDIARAAESSVPNTVNGEAPEEIEVIGQRSRLALRTEIVELETRMFTLFNELNDEQRFDVRCEEAIVTGSRIPERQCMPEYMKQAFSNETRQFLFIDGTKSMNTKGAPANSAEQVWFHNSSAHEDFNVKFRELAAAHPELAAAAVEWQTKRARLQELEKQDRHER